VSVLQKPEVRARYKELFVGAHADFGDLELDENDPRHAMVKRHNPNKLRPVLVFLDGEGKEVFRHRGKVEHAEQALLIARFVAEKHYLKGDFRAFRAAN
jgi:thioredoxin-related protein